MHRQGDYWSSNLSSYEQKRQGHWDMARKGSQKRRLVVLMFSKQSSRTLGAKFYNCLFPVQRACSSF
jgi:hypothetical protein